MTQPTTPNTVEPIKMLRDAFITYMSAPTVRNYDALLDAIPVALDAQPEQPASPTVAGSIDTPQFDALIGNLIAAFEEGVEVGTSMPLERATAKLIAHINARLAPAAPSGEAVAWAVTAERSGIHKLSITKESADRKHAAWLAEWPNNKSRVRPLVFGDTAPSEIEAAIELPEKPSYQIVQYGTKYFNEDILTSYATEAVLKDRANNKEWK